MKGPLIALQVIIPLDELNVTLNTFRFSHLYYKIHLFQFGLSSTIFEDLIGILYALSR